MTARSYSRRDLLKAIGLGAAALPLGPSPLLAAKPRRRPNVLLFLADDLGIADDTIIIFASDNGGNMYNEVEGPNRSNGYELYKLAQRRDDKRTSPEISS